MFKFFIASKKKLKNLAIDKIEKDYVYIYMVWEGSKYVWKNLVTKKHTFKNVSKMIDKTSKWKIYKNFFNYLLLFAIN